MQLIELDPYETNPAKGDIISLSNYQIRWRVNRIDGAMMYLRSELGSRFGTAPIGRVTGIWRDPEYTPDIDWSQFYDEPWLENEVA